MTAAVRKLHTELVAFRKAETAEKKAASAVKKGAATEKATLQGIAAKQQQITDTFESMTPAQQTAAAKQMYQLGQQAQTARDTYAKQVRTEKTDASKVKHDRKVATKELAVAKKDMKKADVKRITRELRA